MSDFLPDRASTGVRGLDRVLYGGLVPGRSYLVRGAPGTGKTLLGFHFLTDGAPDDESTLYINLEEPEADIRQNAASLGVDLADVRFLDLSPTSDFFAERQGYDVFESGDVETEPMAERIVERVEDLDPDRVFVDPVTQFRYLASDEYQFRKQVVSFMRFLKERETTVLFTSQRSSATPDDDLQFLADGVVELAREGHGRTVAVPKFRGSDRQGGTHALTITDAGVSVYPKLRPGEHGADFDSDAITSGVDGLDEMLGGGIERGTITVLSGPTGAGKTTAGTLFLAAAARRGERAAVFHFEETADTFRHRSAALGIPVTDLEADGTLSVQEVEPLALSAEEFADRVRRQVEAENARVVMIDGISGYKLSLRESAEALVRKLHALGRYLKSMGVTVILVDEIDAVTGEFRATDTGISYLADNVVFLRHVEMNGELRKVIGVLKKRVSTFESTLREFRMEDGEIAVGEPLTGLQGVLSGTPEITDE
ncbi:MAG: ATPase domain-containing protein [Haloarculaceae archaeon]